MKKQLPAMFSIALCCTGIAWGQMIPHKQDVTNLRANKNDGYNFAAVGMQKPVNHYRPQSSGDRVVNKIPFTGSRNAFGLIVTESNCLTANQQLNAVMFTHRISNEFNPPNVNSGFVQNTFTTNYGNSWDSIVQTNDGVNLCRFPSGAIFNPAGNNNINNAFATISGPINSGSGWIGNYFSSARLDSTNINPIFAIDGTPGVTNQGFARIGATATDQFTVVTGGLYADPNGADATAQGYRGASLNYATPAANNTYSWSVDSIKPNFLIDATGANETYTTAQTAWNKAGNIGYVVFNGIDADAYNAGIPTGYAPIVYKTTDGGASWTKIPPYNFTSLPAIGANLINTTAGGPPKAWFSQSKGYDVAVDANGQLHIFCTIESAYSNNIDSLGYTYTYAAADVTKTFYMYDTYTINNGWNAVLVDSLNTDNAVNFSPFINGTDGSSFEMDARMQMSRSDDGSKLFYIWSDSYPDISIQVENASPNIYGRAYDVNTNTWSVTKQFTTDAENYFMYVSNITLQSGTLYKTPVTVSLPVDWPNSADVLNPMRHYFVTGIEFNQSEFTITSNQQTAAPYGLEIGEVLPNPVLDAANININIVEPSKVSIDIYNAIGGIVNTIDYGTQQAGKHQFSLSTEHLASGMYYCTVHAGAVKVTKKMMVK